MHNQPKISVTTQNNQNLKNNDGKNHFATGDLSYVCSNITLCYQFDRLDINNLKSDLISSLPMSINKGVTLPVDISEGIQFCFLQEMKIKTIHQFLELLQLKISQNQF